ncbi:GntR family transcriptional regulator, LSA1692 subfamily [Companilactobacillus sp. HBUAS56275]|uniref:GntR family transcriptional regulator n=1 Tax=Candidatus Companilactobacillus pullicola TaxID=2838523 RepID=A0A9D2CN62_9LACO|nr:GntR family transcriptional regulator [Candidatus Companilactobacillus pullicola]
MKYLYSKIADKIEKDIKDGEFGIHQKLPAENELSFRFETSRLTIRKAIEELQRRDLVVKDRNRGTFVMPPETKKISSGLNGLYSFSEVARRQHMKPGTVVLNLETARNIPDLVKKQLHLRGDEPVWKLERLRLGDGEPLTHEEIYLQKRFVPNLTKENAATSLFEMIEKNISIAYASQELEAVILEGRISKLLHNKAGEPTFLVHTTSYSADGYPILHDESYYRSDKYSFHNILYRHH